MILYLWIGIHVALRLFGYCDYSFEIQKYVTSNWHWYIFMAKPLPGRRLSPHDRPLRYRLGRGWEVWNWPGWTLFNICASVLIIANSESRIVAISSQCLWHFPSPKYCEFCLNRVIPYSHMCVCLPFTGVTSQLLSIIWWFRPCKLFFSSRLTTWTIWTTWTTWTILSTCWPNNFLFFLLCFSSPPLTK